MAAVAERIEAQPDLRAQLADCRKQITEETAKAAQAREKAAQAEREAAQQQIAIDRVPQFRAKLIQLHEAAACGDEKARHQIAAVEKDAQEMNDIAARASPAVAGSRAAAAKFHQQADDAQARIEPLRRQYASVLVDLLDAEALREREALSADELRFARETVARRLGRVVAMKRLAANIGASMAAVIDSDIVEMPSIGFSKWSPQPGGSVRHAPIVRIDLQREIETAAAEAEDQVRAELGL